MVSWSLFVGPLMRSWCRTHGSSSRYIKLVKNFRSHASILEYPNERFYEGELQVCGPALQINAFVNSPLLPEPKFPVVFHAVAGENERESSSPSYFNIDEAVEVVDYVRELLEDRTHPIRKPLPSAREISRG